ncbi:MAG: hypothetical protein JXA99_12500 [Candidatus Lokiarchaeota archaeon]|nr:hypothetical protein [Candidatus Lokiarchaeota archaeon]
MCIPKDNRKSRLRAIFLTVLIIFIGFNLAQKDIHQIIDHSEETNIIENQSIRDQALGEGILHDKVHTFHENQKQIEIHVYFLKGFNYWLSSAVVTDGHSCHMNITLISLYDVLIKKGFYFFFPKIFIYPNIYYYIITYINCYRGKNNEKNTIFSNCNFIGNVHNVPKYSNFFI